MILSENRLPLFGIMLGQAFTNANTTPSPPMISGPGIV
jgi:hypothetical protein